MSLPDGEDLRGVLERYKSFWRKRGLRRRMGLLREKPVSINRSDWERAEGWGEVYSQENFRAVEHCASGSGIREDR